MTTNTPGSVRTLGTLRAADGKGIVRLEDRFDTDMDDLWSALTDPRRLARWLGEVEGDLRQGGEFRARFFASGWEGTGRVEVCEPPQRLLISDQVRRRTGRRHRGDTHRRRRPNHPGHRGPRRAPGPDRRLRGRRPDPRRRSRRLPRRP